MTEDAALAWVFQIIGSIQYLAISSPAISGMYGDKSRAAVNSGMPSFIARAVEELDAPVGG